MDFSLKLKRIFDEEYIKSVISEMWNDVCEDGHDLEDFDPKVNENCWVRLDDIGLYNLHPSNSSTLEIHAFIRPKHRKEKSEESGREILKWILDNAPEQYHKVIAQVPSLYPNVKDFCIKNGFKIEGINRMSHMKNGNLFNQWMLGITREEIKNLLKCKMVA